MVINNCYVFSFSNASNSNSAFIIASFVYKIHSNLIFIINFVFTGFDMNIGIARSNHILQLSYVYSVSIVFTCYYALDSAVTVKSILVNLNIAAFKADASCASACTSDGLNTLQGSIHRQAVFVNYQVLLAVFQLNVNLLIGDGNTLTFSQSYACNLVIHILSCSLQLCYVYSIGSFAASCYIGNLTSKGSTAYRYSTTVGSPSKAVCTFRSKSTNNTGFCCSISN